MARDGWAQGSQKTYASFLPEELVHFSKYTVALIGIDPGLHGGLTRIDDSISVHRTPLIRIKSEKDQFDTLAMADLIRVGDTVWIELVGARPGQGVVSMFRFGFGAGLWAGICGARKISPKYVTPRIWKRFHGLGSAKDEARELASKLAPDLARHWRFKNQDGIAESFLIARYGLAQG